MGSRWSRLLATAATLALATTACAATAEDEPGLADALLARGPTQEGWIEEADAVCARLNRTLRSLGELPFDPERARAWVDDLHREMQRSLVALYRLDPPAADRATVDGFLELWTTGMIDSRRSWDMAFLGDAEATRALSRSAKKAIRSGNRLANRYGLEDCSEGTERVWT